MLRLVSKSLSKKEKDCLKSFQDQIDAISGFEDKSKKAQSLWKVKGSKKADEKRFDNIRQKLMGMTVSIETCNYCEHNEATDIEHIFPKTFFPERAFDWENYLLACKTCNTGYKLDQCLVLDPSHTSIKVKRGNEPPYKDLAFINPRTEDPNQFLYLNTQTWQFELLPNLNARQKAKALGTCEILSLNTRSALKKAREENAKYIYERLDKLFRIMQAKDLNEVKGIVSPYNNLNPNLDLAALKVELKKSFLADIEKRSHPSVWFWIRKIDSKTNPKWMRLFESFPELVLY